MASMKNTIVSHPLSVSDVAKYHNDVNHNVAKFNIYVVFSCLRITSGHKKSGPKPAREERKEGWSY